MECDALPRPTQSLHPLVSIASGQRGIVSRNEVTQRGGFFPTLCPLVFFRKIHYTTDMIKYDASTLKYARENRRQRNATRQEGVLWHCFLKNSSVHFYRQYRVGAYILDFYCPKRKLAIELDGGQHFDDEAILYDERRTAFLNQNGIEVLRFSNDDVDKRLNEVTEVIRQALEHIKRAD